MRFVDLLEELLACAEPSPPTAAWLRAHFAARATAVTTAGPGLVMPAWADWVGGADDVYLTLGGDVAGMHLHEDPRGYGAYATIAVTNGTRADIEARLGPGSTMPRAPGAIASGPELAFQVRRGNQTVRVFAEFVATGSTGLRRVKIHFQR